MKVIMMIGGICWYMYAKDGKMCYLHHHGAWSCDFAAHAQDLWAICKMSESGTPEVPEVEADRARGSAGGCIAHSVIAGWSITSGTQRAPVHSGVHTWNRCVPYSWPVVSVPLHMYWQFYYLIFVAILTWSVCLMGHSSLLLSFILSMDACVRCWATCPLFPHFWTVSILLASD